MSFVYSLLPMFEIGFSNGFPLYAFVASYPNYPKYNNTAPDGTIMDILHGVIFAFVRRHRIVVAAMTPRTYRQSCSGSGALTGMGFLATDVILALAESHRLNVSA